MITIQTIKKILIGKSIRYHHDSYHNSHCGSMDGFIEDVYLSDILTSRGFNVIIKCIMKDGYQYNAYADNFNFTFEYHDGNSWSHISSEYYYGGNFSGTARYYFTFKCDEV